MDAKQLHDLGQQLRVDAVRAAAAAASGHPTSSMSAADLMAVLLAEHLRYDFTLPGYPGNDRLIFSKGHASPLLYAMYQAAGVLGDGELLGFRSLGSRLEGHCAFGWHTIEIDGHDIEAIGAAYTEALATRGRPTAILARTRKGRGVRAVEDAEGAHGKPLPDTDEAVKVLRSSDADQVTIIAAGITVHEALRAADSLAAGGLPARVIDLYSVKPVDTQALRAAAGETGAFVTVEDHWPEGGLGDAVLAAFANGHRAPRITKLAVHAMPGSATPDEQLHAAGIDAAAIEAAARALAADRVALR